MHVRNYHVNIKSADGHFYIQATREDNAHVKIKVTTDIELAEAIGVIQYLLSTLIGFVGAEDTEDVEAT